MCGDLGSASDVTAELSLERPEEVTSEESLAAAMAEVKAGSRWGWRPEDTPGKPGEQRTNNYPAV